VAEIRPFRALRYNPQTAGELQDLVSPPYDVIGPEERERLRAQSTYNVVHLTLPDEEEDAGPVFEHWVGEGVLTRDELPALWWIEQEFTGPDGIHRIREGIACSVKVEPYENRVVLPHERTHSGPKESRLRLLRAVRAQLEPIFLLYDSPAEPEQHLRALAEREPDLSVDDGQVETRAWHIDDQDVIHEMQQALVPTQLLIADGHHRYETAMAFHLEDGSDESAYTFAVLVNINSKGLAIFPTHRLFRKAPEEAETWLANAERLESIDAARARLEASHAQNAFVLYERGQAYLIETDLGILDVEVVDRLGLEGISYTADWDEAVGDVDAGVAELAVLLRPPRVEEVLAAAAAGRVMPQKSTYFYPKLVSGLLFHPLS
jgi:uncharacterized protein (DUF1015 family)